MAELGVIGVNSVSADATRGLPYYEKLKRDLRETIKKKHLLDKNMVGGVSMEVEGTFLSCFAGRFRRVHLQV